MDIEIRPYRKADLPAMREIWNETVEAGNAFPQRDCLSSKEASVFFQEQTCSCVAVDQKTGVVVGLYILHPNAVGRCSHIANASYAVWSVMRSRGIGRKLVVHSLHQAKLHGFRILQFNAVVSSNAAARRLYEQMGFVKLGTIPGGFHADDDRYLDIVLYYHDLMNLENI
ncbi:MAG: GNAT family N-acetyltransferase [Ruminococcus sp.]